MTELKFEDMTAAASGDTLVERISIHEDCSITIQLNYADPFAALRPYHPLAKEAACCE